MIQSMTGYGKAVVEYGEKKIGKFRSETGAELYAEIRSCINTYKKQNYSPFNMLLKSFNGELQII